MSETSRSSARAARPWYLSRWLARGVAALLLYAVLGFLLVPAALRHYLPQIVDRQVARQLSLGELRINPFLLTVEIRDCALREADGADLLSFSRLFVDLEFAGLLHRTWTFADISLESPALEMVIGSDGRLNLATLIETLEGDAAEEALAEDSEPHRIRLEQANIRAGRIRFSDHTGAEPLSAVIEPVDLHLDEFSTLPGKHGRHRITATLPGRGGLEWQGEASLYPLASSGTLAVTDFTPLAIWEFAQRHLGLQKPAGTVNAALDYHVSYADGGFDLGIDSLRFTVDKLALTPQGASAPLLELQSIALDAARFDLATRELVVPAIALRNGRIAASIDEHGELDWARVVPAASDDDPASGQAPWKLRIESLVLDDVTLDLRDASRRAPLRVAVGSTHIDVGLQAELGGVATSVLATSPRFDLERIVWTEQDAQAPLAAVDRFEIAGAELDLAAGALHVPRIALSGTRFDVRRAADGSIRQIAVLEPGSNRDAGEPVVQPTETAPWRVVLDEFSLRGIDVTLADESTQPALEYALADGALVIRNLHSDGSVPFALEARLPIVQGGTIEIGGTAVIGGESADIRLQLEDLSLLPLAPLVARDTNLELTSGTVSGDAQIIWRADGTPSLKSSASAGIERLLLNEAASGERFLEWHSLRAKGIDFSLDPDWLTIAEVRLSGAGAKVLVYKDRSLNLAKVMDRTGAPESPPAAAVEAEIFPLKIDRVRIDKSTVDFADLSLVLPFRAHIEQFRGVLNGISSVAQSRTTLALRGRVGEFGEARVEGSLEPFDPARFTDIEVGFHNVAMPPLSPYSATFAGRAIKGGDLDLELQYKVAEQQLLGENRIVLQDLALGEHIESPDALDLPLDLAIALLSDSEGRIDVAVPVRGNVDAPEFSYGQVVLKALGKLLGDLVTAPFRALGAMFGGGGENPDTLHFQPGQAALAPPEEQLLGNIAQALASRPQLGLEIRTGFDPQLDGAAINDEIVRRALAELMDVTLEPGEDPGPVAFDDPKVQRALENFLEERDGKDALEPVAAQFAATTGQETRRVNRALALVGRGEGDRGFYEFLLAHIVSTTPEPAARLQELARYRAAAITRYLVETSGLEPGRIRSDTTAPVRAVDGVIETKLALGVLGSGAS